MYINNLLIKFVNIKEIKSSLLILFVLIHTTINCMEAKEINKSKDRKFINDKKHLIEDYFKQSIKENAQLSIKNINLISDIRIDKQRIIPTSESQIRIKENLNINLKDLKVLINDNNPEIRIMKSRIKQAEHDLKSKLSEWYPNITLSSNGAPKYQSGNTYNELSIDTSTNQWKTSLTASAQWDLINPSRIPEIEAAKDLLSKEKLNYESNLRDLHLETLNKFFLLQKSNENIRIAKKSLATSKTTYKEANARFESGIGTKLDVLEAKTQLSKDQQFLNAKIGEYKINQRSLAKKLNLNQNVNPIINKQPKLLGIWKATLEESIIAAYKFKKDLQQIKLDLSINNSNANSLLGSTQPTISLYNDFNTSYAKGEAIAVSPNNNNEIYSQSNTVGIKFNWKIFDGGYGRATYNSKKEKSKEIKANFLLKKLEIREAVEDSFFNIDIAKQNILNSYDEINSAKESLRLALLRLEAGITTQREVVNNQRDLTQAEVNYILAITDYNLNLVKLRRQTGIMEIDSCDINKKEPIDSVKNEVEREGSLCSIVL